ncbi:MAG: double-strand break repair protein AddB [Alphaproteobacteria bacterium]|nr:double-strand break repair protein AddB [Alphaproteobacteria bacterium]
MRAKIYTVPTGTPFLPALVRAILNGDLPRPGGPKPDALDLSGYTVILPTRRAERAAAEACLSVTGRSAMLLPRIRAIAGPDEDSLLIGAAASASGIGAGTLQALELPPAIDKTERLLLLTRLVLQWSAALRQTAGGARGDTTAEAGARTPAQAAAMARELADLMDLVEREGRSLDGIASLVPDNFSAHWQKSLDFLRIITEFWPHVLAERGCLSPWDRQNKLLAAEAERLRAAPPEGPVIVAGVTGSIPATVELIRAVAGLDQGAIVLAGLDLGLDEESWERIAPGHPEHPEFGLQKLLEALDVPRADVVILPAAEARESLKIRAGFIGEAMRPTETTAKWRDWVVAADRDAVAKGFENVSLIEAASPQEEAEAIALIMREAAEHADKSAALVTPDRLLARRVAIRLEAWGIRVDDSAGRPFAKTVPGAFLELVIDAVARDFSPVATMALLKHPLARFGMSAREVRFAARALELAAFRTAYIGAGIEGIESALDRARDEIDARERRDMAAERLWGEDWERAHALLDRLREACAPLTEAFCDNAERPLSDFAARHVRVAELASRLTDEEIEAGAEPELYSKEAGEAASGFFTNLLACAGASPDIAANDYPDLYRGLISTLPPVIPRVPKHPRLSIWGPMESQLLTADVVILGSLNETTWPDATDPGPWLNRPMRIEMGLPSPEEETGREARDFIALMGAGEVFLTRARKVDGVPSVPSRWLMRMNALFAGLDLKDALRPGEPWLQWARFRDFAESRPPAARPEPRPPLAARPRRMSVSGVERWIANPYAIYAGEILKLKVLPQLGAEPDAALRGTILHKAMSAFTTEHTKSMPPDADKVLTAKAAHILRAYSSHPRIAAFWLPRFARFAEWFAETEPGRRDGIEQILTEVAGELTFAAPGGDFTLTARADRLDVSNAGVIITDYKTGNPPTDNPVNKLRHPQLPLEAAILAAGGFATVSEAKVAGLRYIKASGGEPPGTERVVKADAGEAALAEAALAALKQLVARYDRLDTPYAAVRRDGYSYDYDDYAHLARVAEWAQAADATATGEGSEGR